MSYRNSTARKRQREQQRGIKFTMLVCGPSGTGKTSFVNSLLDQNVLSHRYAKSLSKDGLPKTVTYANLNGVITNAAESDKLFDPTISNIEPGVAITETNVEIVDEDDSKLLLTVVETPGFGENLDNEMCIREICNFLEQQFDLVLAEETKVRRNPRFEDTRVHACLYFITPTGHGLRELDVQTMKRISKYANVIPVIGRADSFTQTELLNFKRRVNEDIERFKIPIFQFTADEEEDDHDVVEEAHFLSQLQPFAVITSDEEETKDGKTSRYRTYPWGKIDINDTSFSDFAVLKSVLLGSHLQDLKDITDDYLYENYRTERLSGVSDLKGDFPFTNTQSQPPSMSNLAEVAKAKTLEDAGVQSVTAKSAQLSIDTDDDDASVSTPVANAYSPSSLASSQFASTVDTRKLRKISETVPYMLRHESLVTKQQKLEELERQSAVGLAKRAAELEKKAMELKLKEKRLRERISKTETTQSVSEMSYVEGDDL